MPVSGGLKPDGVTNVGSKEFIEIVESVKEAILNGTQPIRIVKGSSGSYFARNTEGVVVGVFKPKDEEPFGTLIIV